MFLLNKDVLNKAKQWAYTYVSSWFTSTDGNEKCLKSRILLTVDD